MPSRVSYPYAVCRSEIKIVLEAAAQNAGGFNVEVGESRQHLYTFDHVRAHSVIAKLALLL
jgi:hypothetical protein